MIKYLNDGSIVKETGQPIFFIFNSVRPTGQKICKYRRRNLQVPNKTFGLKTFFQFKDDDGNETGFKNKTTLITFFWNIKRRNKTFFCIKKYGFKEKITHKNRTTCCFSLQETKMQDCQNTNTTKRDIGIWKQNSEELLLFQWN